MHCRDTEITLPLTLYMAFLLLLPKYSDFGSTFMHIHAKILSFFLQVVSTFGEDTLTWTIMGASEVFISWAGWLMVSASSTTSWRERANSKIRSISLCTSAIWEQIWFTNEMLMQTDTMHKSGYKLGMCRDDMMWKSIECFTYRHPYSLVSWFRVSYHDMKWHDANSAIYYIEGNQSIASVI